MPFAKEDSASPFYNYQKFEFLHLLSIVRPDEQRRCDADWRVCTDDDTDDECQNEVEDGLASEDEQGAQGDDYREWCVDRTWHCFREGAIGNFTQRSTFTTIQMFTQPVEDDDGVVYREAENGEHGRDEKRIDFDSKEFSEENKEAEGNEQIMQ